MIQSGINQKITFQSITITNGASQSIEFTLYLSFIISSKLHWWMKNKLIQESILNWFSKKLCTLWAKQFSKTIRSALGAVHYDATPKSHCGSISVKIPWQKWWWILLQMTSCETWTLKLQDVCAKIHWPPRLSHHVVHGHSVTSELMNHNIFWTDLSFKVAQVWKLENH